MPSMPGRERMSAPLSVEVERTPEYALLRLDGELALRDVPAARTTLVKLLLDASTVLVDLAGLRLTRPMYVQLFGAALDNAGGWPRAKLALFGADAELADALKASRVGETISVSDSVEDAKRSVGQRPHLVRLRCELDATLAAPRHARAFLRDACHLWEVGPELTDAGLLVVSELVSNAVQHAQTATRLVLELQGDALCIRVRDFSTRRPVAHPSHGQLAVWGQGLELVDQLANRWNVVRHADGKTLWATVTLGPPPDNVVPLAGRRDRRNR